MITAMGIGTKQAPENVNLDPQSQFWSWLSAFKNPDELGDNGHHERAYFSGFACTQTSPAGMSIQIGGGDDVDSAAIFINSDRAVLLSTDGTPQTVTIPTAPASGSRIDAVVSYIDTTSADPESETPGTPEYVHTIVVSGTAASSPSAPTDAEIVSALPAGAGGTYYRWCDVRVAQGATTITNSNITDKKPASPNLYWTTSDFNDAADNRIDAKVPGMIVARNPYVAYSRVQKANAEAFRAIAPAARSGYKFLCWVYTTTEGQAAEWNVEFPDQASTNCFYIAPSTFPGTHYIRNYALYVPIS